MSPPALKLLIILLCSGLALAQNPSTTASPCPPGCHCNYVTRVVRCQSDSFSSLPASFPSYTTTLTLTNIALMNLPPDSFQGLSDLVSLDLTSCQISGISPGAFNGLENLRILTLQVNHLSTLSPDMFTGLVSLRELNLARNLLQSLPNGAFENTPNLQVLDLSNNPLFQIDNETFSGLPSLVSLHMKQGQQVAIPVAPIQNLTNLRTLDLSMNPIPMIPPRSFATLGSLSLLYLNNMALNSLEEDAFEGLYEVTSIDLSYNFFQTLSPAIFQALTSLDTLILTGNEWNCSCPMQPFIQWLRQSEINYYSTNWYCATPRRHQGQVVYGLALRDFACEPIITVAPSHTILDYGDRATFQCQAIGDPAPTIQWYTPDGRMVSSTSNANNTYTAVFGTVLVIQFAREDSVGIYNCSAVNARGQASSRFQVIVQGLPTPTATQAPPQQGTQTTATPTVLVNRITCTNAFLQIWSTDVTDNSISVSWTPYNGEEELNGYIVQVHVFGDVQTSSYYVNWTDATYRIRNLLPGTGYTVCASYLLENCPLVTPKEQCREIMTQGEDLSLTALRTKHRNELIGTALACLLGTLFLMGTIFLILWHCRKPRRYKHYDFKNTRDTATFADIPEDGIDNDILVSNAEIPYPASPPPHGKVDMEDKSHTNLAIHPADTCENEYVSHPFANGTANQHTQPDRVEHSVDVHSDLVEPPPGYSDSGVDTQEELNATDSTASLKSTSTTPPDEENLAVTKEQKDDPSKVKKTKKSLSSEDSIESDEIEMTNIGIPPSQNGDILESFEVEVV
ncbi:uncharacterized protein [Diadema setosum]|uniref:uncharacterized protein n=1 Tax=Diadema setosum TaxID=31175 RepID=UPI003B3BBC4F